MNARPAPRFRALPLFLALIPTFFCALLYALSPNLYIPAFNLSISHSTLSYVTLVWAFVWSNCLPIRIACQKHLLSEIAFYVFPTTFPALLIFAQWHFVAALVLLAAVIAAWVIAAIRLFPRRGSPPRFPALIRCLVTVCAVILLFPTLITTFQYHLLSPTYSVSQQLLASLAESQTVAQEPEDLFSSNKDLLMEFSPERWDSHTLEEKVVLVQELANFECRRFGIPSVTVAAETLDAGVLGNYRHSLNTIFVNTVHLDRADPVDIISTITHESHHAFAAWLCTNTDFEDPVTDTLLYAQVCAWKENSANYVSAVSDYNGYTNQPIERDAILWSEEETARIQACWGG